MDSQILSDYPIKKIIHHALLKEEKVNLSEVDQETGPAQTWNSHIKLNT